MIGAAGSLAAQTLGSGTSADIRAVAYVAHTNRIGDWRVRALIGAGVDAATYSTPNDGVQGYLSGSTPAMPAPVQTATETLPVGQLAVTLAHTLGRQWGLEVGPVLTIYPTQSTIMGVLPRQADVVFYAGLQHRL